MPDLSECRVLLVDDVSTNIDVLMEALRGEYKLSMALNGESALKVAAKTQPDLILLDIMMPGIDGYEVCRRLKADPATREIPILFLSALADGDNKATAFEVGGTDYVTKPFELLEVKARVRSLLKAKKYQDAVREQIAGELRIARAIQMSLVPRDFPSLGDGMPFDLFGVLEPASEVGGDLYQFLPLSEGRLCAYIGDVSGKGVSASLFMAITSTLIRAAARQLHQPEEILSRVNEELAADNPACMFVTLLCAVVDVAAARMRLASGGHTPPVLLRPGEAPRLLFESPGTAVGIAPGVPFERLELSLAPGDTVLFYTDGITEAFDREGRCFSEAGLLEHLSRSPGASARETVAGLLRAVKTFSEGAAQSDDIAILALKYAPARGAA